jgi:hydroxymethylbilane synthase
VTTTRTLVAGTRGSVLALAQTALVLDALRAAHSGLDLRLEQIRTQGDRDKASPLAAIGGTGIFVKELEAALLDGRIDLAVHSLKDMPSTLTDGLTLAAITPRGDPRDALVSRDGCTLTELPGGARIGTSSRRRQAELLLLRPDIVPVELRGNVDTRIRKVRAGEVDAAVLAVAGLERLGRLHEASQLFSVDEFLPAVGQAALAVEARANDAAALALLAAIDDPPSHTCAAAERAFLRRLGGGCTTPAAAYAELNNGRLRLRALLVGDNGAPARGERTSAPSEAEALGAALAEALLAMGGVT